jgi:hypothetical protein
MTPREQAIELAERYKQIEIEFNRATRSRQDRLRAEVAKIAYQMFDLGYSLPNLIEKRQIKDQQLGIKHE